MTETCRFFFFTRFVLRLVQHEGWLSSAANDAKPFKQPGSVGAEREPRPRSPIAAGGLPRTRASAPQLRKVRPNRGVSVCVSNVPTREPGGKAERGDGR